MTDEHHPGAGAAEAQAVSALAETFLADLRDWTTIPAISGDPAHRADLTRSAEALARRLDRDGWPRIRLWAHDSVFAEWPGAPGAPTLLLYTHHDVPAPAALRDWRFPPFEPTRRDGQLFGLGVRGGRGRVAAVRQGVRAHLAATGARTPSAGIKLLVDGRGLPSAASLYHLLGEHAETLRADKVLCCTGEDVRERAAPVLAAALHTPVSDGLPALTARPGPGADERVDLTSLSGLAEAVATLVRTVGAVPNGLTDRGSAA
ncbi:acetylornithine deacetylase/succinyl-diaminopimelate desuccinylase-like protein [Crossiella equi]|uniref:Acetylornithine deacetylase/succinyl-diaminopimelate desuccinylase-like protein n=1 Tax=Crossiella equi TaxID=130796 RepID=A0ABS5AJK4_9PSEU|nr:hypothetical protein [Crossiella equi]MBP2476571.1 acetylornithine deacetylase/succinyl-diaminopimelate desuccinylase-like protein [Crossiella equi]